MNSKKILYSVNINIKARDPKMDLKENNLIR